MKSRTAVKIGLGLVASVLAMSATAQTVKIGFISTYSGPMASLGEEMERAVKLYMKLNGDKLPAGVKVELVARDDGGPNPDKGKQLAQELIVRDHVNFLAGVVWTPSAIAIAPLVTEAKVPFIVMNAGGSVITTLSPYIVRTSFTLWQAAYPMGQWAAKKYKRAYIAVSDFAPGHDSEAAFEKGFVTGGGEIVGRVRMPVSNPDFIPFMQRAKDAKPDIVFSFIPGGVQSTQIMKAFGDLGLAKAGVKFVGTGDIVSDEELPNMGDAPLGAVTAHHLCLGNRIGNVGRLITVITVNRNRNQFCIPHGRQTHAVFKNLHRFRGLQRLTIEIFFAPFYIQVPGSNNIAQNYLRLHDLKSSLNKIWIVIVILNHRRTVQALNISAIGLHFNPRGTGIGFWQDESNRGGNNGGDQENGNYNRLANANYPPIIEKM